LIKIEAELKVLFQRHTFLNSNGFVLRYFNLCLDRFTNRGSLRTKKFMWRTSLYHLSSTSRGSWLPNCNVRNY